jgi:hypothetical protein
MIALTELERTGNYYSSISLEGLKKLQKLQSEKYSVPAEI